MYVKPQSSSFEYAITQSLDTKEMDRNYQKSDVDDNGNQVAFITKEKYEELIFSTLNRLILKQMKS